MRSRRPTRLAALIVAVATVLVAGAPSAPATVASDGRLRGARCPAAARAAVTEAYAAVFDRGRAIPAEARAARLAGGDDPALRAVLDAWLADPAGASSTVTATRMVCRRARTAVVDGDLTLAGTPLPAVLPAGRAVLDGGTWKVSRPTFCTRMILERPVLAEAGPCRTRK